VIWKILGLVGAGSFIINGLTIIADPNCVTVDFGGQSRIVTTTCHNGYGGTLAAIPAGMLLIFFGFGILVLLFWRNFKNLLPSSQNSSTYSSNKPASRSGSRGKVCNYCKQEIPSKSRECPNCFPEVISSNTTEEKVVKDAKKLILKSQPKNIEKLVAQSTPEFKTCPMCAEDIKLAAKKCRYCQHMLDI